MLLSPEPQALLACARNCVVCVSGAVISVGPKAIRFPFANQETFVFVPMTLTVSDTTVPAMTDLSFKVFRIAGGTQTVTAIVAVLLFSIGPQAPVTRTQYEVVLAGATTIVDVVPLLTGVDVSPV